MGQTLISGTGNLTRDPEVRRLANGMPVTRVTVAVNDSRFNRNTNSWEHVNTSFFNLTCWRSLADRAAEDLRRGDPVYFAGRLQVKRYQKHDGNWDAACDVDVDAIGPDLRRAKVELKRPRPDDNAATQQQAAVATDPWTHEVTQPAAVSEPAA